MVEEKNTPQNFDAHLFDCALPHSESDLPLSEFVSAQLKMWPLAAANYHQLRKVIKRSVFFTDFKIDIQYNPARKRSTCANLSKDAIEQRPCFLCVEHLPVEQKGVLLLEKYFLLLNPYPIFNEHFTISSVQHVPQLITNRLDDMLQLSHRLKGRTVFYNGAECGASAPDHFHFQCVPGRVLPFDIELDMMLEKNAQPLIDEKNGRVVLIESYLRECLVLESEQAGWIVFQFNNLLSKLPVNEHSGEPMMNILARFEYGKYRVALFPRQKQRPQCFYAENEDKIMISPASVEMGGVLITPRKEDFEKITKQDIINIFEEVSYSISL
ncbi:MAG: DUF4922 domain-containing protein [Prolixibacteraceae bacterium]|nr:DUF4922 domain-containing protein [Prolixibacteraceae bacterium]MBN2650382.1 DUF4922 domain-containing protein [Prolixibacteraceae bacterium]